LYTSIDDLNHALSANHIPTKKIKSILPIGMAKEYHLHDGFHLLRKELHLQGSPLWNQSTFDYWEKRYPWLEEAMIRCEVTLEEPLVILFDDNTTMELLPEKDHGLRLSFNQISCDIQNGVNDNNFYAQNLFGSLECTSIKGLLGWQDTQIKLDDSDYYNATVRSYQFWCSGELGFTLKEHLSNQYKLELTNQCCFTDYHRNVPARISFSNYMRAAKPIKQIYISANGSNGNFSLMPTQWKPEDGFINYAKCQHKEAVVLMEDDAYAFLLYYFSKHRSNLFPDRIWGDWEEHKESDDDMLYNTVISYDYMRVILEDIRQTSTLLKTDYNNPKLDNVKAMFDPSSFQTEHIFITPRPDNQEVIKENIDVVIHFYERFCWCIENMMKNNPQFQHISIWGP